MSRKVISSLAVAVLALVFMPGQAPAAVVTWDAGGGADNNINTAANWNPDGVPDLTSGASDLVFGTAGSSARVNTPVNVDKITINRAAASFQLLHQTSTTGSLTIGAGGVTTAASSGTGRAYFIKENVTATGAQTWSTNSSCSLTLDNDLANTGLTALTVTLSGGDLTLSTPDASANAITFSAGSVITGNAGSIITGRVNFNNTTTDSYTGNTTIGALGTLAIGSADALPFGAGKGNVVMNSDSSSLGLNGSDLKINGLSSGGAGSTLARIYNNVATGTSAQTLTVGNNDATATFNGTIIDHTANSRKIALTKVGAGTQTLAGANTYTGATTISGGTLQLGNGDTTGTLSSSSAIIDNANLSINRSNAVVQGTDFSSSAITGSGSLTQAGSSTLTLNAANTFNGDTKVSGGTLTLANTLALQNSTLDYNTYGGSLSFGTLTAATLGGLKGNQNLALTNESAANVALTTGNNDGNATYSGAISGGGLLTKVGAGTFTLSGSNNYSGGTTLSAGTLLLGSADAIGAIGTITFSGGTLQFSASNTADYSARFNNGANQPFKFDTNSQSVTLASNLTSSGGSLTKLGAGTLAVSGTNTYDGGTTLNAGTLALGSAGALGTTGTISFTGGTLQFSGSNATDYSARFSNAASQQYKLDTNGQAVALASALASSGGTLTKLGGGTLTLSGNNTYDGGTTVSAGTLAVNASLAGNVTVSPGAVLQGTGTIGGTVTLASGAGATISPGNSPGTITTGGLMLNDGVTGHFELQNSAGAHAAGLNASDYLDIGGALDLSAISTTISLDVSAIGGGDITNAGSWILMTANSVVPGSFSLANITVTGVDSGYSYGLSIAANDTNPTRSDLILTTTVAGLPGDFNHDNFVDAADYVFWRKNLGDATNYDLWRSNFGNHSGSGSSLSQAAVPEPGAMILGLVGGAVITVQRTRRRVG